METGFMKKIISLMFLLFFSFKIFSQNDNITKKIFNSYLNGNHNTSFNLITEYILKNPLSPYSQVLTEMLLENHF